MKVQTFDSGRRFLSIILAVVWVITFAGITSARDDEGNIRKIQQGLVGGSLVSPEVQEQYGLLSLDTGCSASLLRNDWAITAAHCIDDPDPARAGEFIQVPEDSVTVKANWKNVQLRRSVRIISFRPNDVAIIRVAEPFSVTGSTRAYNRDIFRGSLASLKITAYGRGIFQLAQGSGAGATRARGDNQYRVGYFTVDGEGDGEYSFPSVGGQSLAGGDSGGPSFTKLPSGEVLVGVHSSGETECLPDKVCSGRIGDWTWIAATPRTFDASIAPLWDEIDRYLGAFVPATAPPPPPPVWQNWFRITNGGGLKAPVTALMPRPDHLDLFVVGNDGGVYSTFHEGAGGWQNWFRIGDLKAPTQSPVTALATRPGHIDLFVVSNDGGVYSTYHEAAGGWRPWFRIGYVGVAPRSNVEALQPRPGHIDLFVVGSDAKVYSTFFEAPNGWQNWFPIHEMRSPLGSQITALLSRPGHIDLFVSGAEGGVYSTYHEAAGGWRQWSRIWGVDMLPGSPITALALPTARVSLFVVDKDKKVFSTYRLGASDWQGWLRVANLGATPGTRVAALDTRLGHTDLFAVGNDGGIYSTYVEGNDWQWQPWFRVTNMMSTPGAAVTALLPRPGHVDLFVSGLDSGVYSTFHETGVERIGTTSTALNTAPVPEPIRAQPRVIPVPGTPPTAPKPICESARLARERNSPAAPGLEETCRAVKKGEAIASKDPLAVELRNQQPNDSARQGFDIGLAVAEGHTAPGPGKDKTCASLHSSEEQGGCRIAVSFSVERNHNAKLASSGAAIAETDSVVSAARSAETDVFFRLGFDIASGIFGSPALGAQGNTATGPGSLGIRDSLSAAGQRGFNAAVTFHLGRRNSTGARSPESPAVTNNDHFGSGGATGRAREAFQPENTVKVSVRYRKEYGYLGDTNAFGYVGPTSCSAFSVSVAVGDGSVGQRNPIRISSDSKMQDTDGYYFCSYLVSEIPLNQPIRVSVGLSGFDQSAAWKGGSQGQPPPGQQRTIIIVSGRGGGFVTLTATQPRARQLFEMVYAPPTPR